MSLWQRLVRAVAPSGLATPSDWLVSMFGGGPSKAGARVTPETAVGLTAVWRAVNLLSTSMASLPLVLYRRRSDGGKERADDHPLYALLHDRPNPQQTSYEWRQMSQAHLELRGNAYSYLESDRRGVITALWPLNPARMQVLVAPDDTIWYEYTSRRGATQQYRADEILHQRGFSPDGVIGWSPITVAREAIGVSLAAEDYAGTFFGNGTMPGGVLESPKAPMTDDNYKRFLAKWNAAHKGAGNAHKAVLLEEGMTYKQVGISAKDAQFLESRKFQIEEVARIFGVPLHLLNSMDRSTFSNIEHQSIEFVTHSIRPRAVCAEQRMNATLLLERERGTLFVEHKIDGLLRGDLKTRYESYAIARNWGWMSADDVRELENMNPLPDGQGKIYLMPTNMADAKDPPPAPAPATPPAPTPVAADENDDETRAAHILASYEPVLVDAFARATRKELVALQRNALGDAASTVTFHETFWRQHEATVAEQLMPAVSGLLRAVHGPSSDVGLRAVVIARAMAVREHEMASTMVRTALVTGPLTDVEFDAWRDQRPARATARELVHLLPALLEGVIDVQPAA